MHLYGTQSINEKGHLTIGGVDAVDLAAQYGTPLFVYDIALFRERAQAFQKTFENEKVGYQVAYASKAFSGIAIYQVAAQEGLSLDVVSGGELYTAIQSGFPKEKIHFHGNNKSQAEIDMAFDEEIGCIVVDNFHEIELLKKTAERRQQKMNILLRVTPGIEAHTHDYITTGQEDSKFGFDLNNGQADRAFKETYAHEHLELIGLHCHIGSQIFETAAFQMASEKLLLKMAGWKQDHSYTCSVLNLGGGFGIRYTEEDAPLEPAVYVKDMIRTVKTASKGAGFPVPEIWIEPGRSLIGDAGTTLYTIGSTKDVPDTRRYAAVDGGMSDNIRPALYGAKYSSLLANRAQEQAGQVYTIAGKCCESGDKLIEEAQLPEVSAGDILAVFCTGAYGYSMASNYNRITRPAVVFVEEGKHQLVIRRESFEDLIKNEVGYVQEGAKR
ncbi:MULTISPECIES: diaminopimelate decarboxylase [unclassified Planococcus (in: firmicutes)]|uniref:diaminopimelate decarboxylase n=1 Tax=Planococcus TaxID=1372 RepID=UPI000C7BE4F7|nr:MULTISPECIES: diaminopimelate decarboxylase [unclassified Planococcus (in: firmicutes)]PKG48042.1 diaminopimelate decarboxylase [Planococcus sp. Urea-trap-24]PKG91890.1 diaminopimelate decarboxylase [Planococcus sp. Urea-3u-39]PKH43206.1 diaminopimelate decarboxylase [Planococcus sp. MB-3u-09]